jgi:hypothetical protein
VKNQLIGDDCPVPEKIFIGGVLLGRNYACINGIAGQSLKKAER